MSVAGRRIRLSQALLVVATAMALAGCGAGGGSSAAPPTVICSVVLSATATAPVVYDITSSGFDASRTVGAPTVGGVVIVRVASGCDVGSEVTITPSDAFKVTRIVRAADHLPVAVVLKPLRSVPAVLVARQHGQEVGRLSLDLPRSDI